jgi:hypothetical protein
MTDFDNTNRGSIWKNEKKERDTHPDFTGSLNVDGVEYWVSAWKRKDGASPKAPALSFSIKPKDDQPQRQAPISQRATAAIRRPDPISSGRNADMDDDIPF